MTTNTMTEAMKADGKALVRAVFEYYMEDGQFHTVAQLASYISWSESKVRRVMNAHHGLPTGMTYDDSAVETYSRNFPGMQHGVKAVRIYGPTRDTMRERIQYLERAADWSRPPAAPMTQQSDV
jgi:hypothetical protein